MFSNKNLLMGAIFGAIGVAVGKKGRRGEFLSSGQLIGGVVGVAAGLATGEPVLNSLGLSGAGLSGLGRLELSEEPNTPLKRQPIQILRTDAAVASFNPNAQPLLNRAAVLQRADRLLIS